MKIDSLSDDQQIKLIEKYPPVVGTISNPSLRVQAEAIEIYPPTIKRIRNLDKKVFDLPNVKQAVLTHILRGVKMVDLPSVDLEDLIELVNLLKTEYEVTWAELDTITRVIKKTPIV